MSNAPSQDEAKVIIALNVLCGNISPDHWRGLVRIDDEQAAILDSYKEVCSWGFAKMEVIVMHGQFETVHQSRTKKRKDLLTKPNP